MLLTLAAARQALWDYGPAKVSYPGTQGQRDDFDKWLNQVIQKFQNSGKPRSTMRKVLIPIYDGNITLPRELQSCSGVKLIPYGTNPRWYRPLAIYSQFHEFHHGPTPDWCCEGGAFPDSELCQTFRVPATGFTLRVKSTETRGSLTLLGGTDATGAEYFDSTTLAITNGTSNNARAYNSLPRIIKSLTNVSVSLYSVISGTETLIAIYAPSETVPAYTRYQVTFATDNSPSCLALCKLAFVKVVLDTDIVYPGVETALITGLLAVERQVAREADAANKLWAQAIDELDKDRQQLDGDAEQTEFHAAAGSGFGNVPLTL